MIRHVLVVAGPSGAGKTTLMRQLATGGLPREIRSRIPAGAEGWPHVHGNQHPTWLTAIKRACGGREETGIVLHYDLTRDELQYVDDYRKDPALEIVSMAAHVTFVHVRPTTDRLIRQWAHDRMGLQSLRQLRNRRIIGAIAGLAAATIRTTGMWPARHRDKILRRLERVRVRSPRVLALYLRAGGVGNVFHAWDRFIESTRADGVDLSEINVAPDPTSPVGRDYRWRLNEGRHQGCPTP